MSVNKTKTVIFCLVQKGGTGTDVNMTKIVTLCRQGLVLYLVFVQKTWMPFLSSLSKPTKLVQLSKVHLGTLHLLATFMASEGRASTLISSVPGCKLWNSIKVKIVKYSNKLHLFVENYNHGVVCDMFFIYLVKTYICKIYTIHSFCNLYHFYLK